MLSQTVRVVKLKYNVTKSDSIYIITHAIPFLLLILAVVLPYIQVRGIKRSFEMSWSS